MATDTDVSQAQLLPEIIGMCLESLEEIKRAYTEAHELRTRVVELEKVAAERQPEAPKVDTALINQTVRNLVASSFLDAEHSTKLASELTTNPSAALKLVQRFIEISTPAFSEGAGVAKSASESITDADPDGWATVINKGA